MDDASSYTYRAIVSNDRQESQETSFDDRAGNEMRLIPTHRGLVMVGTLKHVYCKKNFMKNKNNVASLYSSKTFFFVGTVEPVP